MPRNADPAASSMILFVLFISLIVVIRVRNLDIPNGGFDMRQNCTGARIGFIVEQCDCAFSRFLLGDLFVRGHYEALSWNESKSLIIRAVAQLPALAE
jgi:hypothetical protein